MSYEQAIMHVPHTHVRVNPLGWVFTGKEKRNGWEEIAYIRHINLYDAIHDLTRKYSVPGGKEKREATPANINAAAHPREEEAKLFDAFFYHGALPSKDKRDAALSLSE